MAKCVGCGLEVNSGILEVKLKPGGGIACDPNTGLYTDPGHNTDPTVIAVVHNDTNCITMAGGGTVASPLTASPKIAPDNTLCKGSKNLLKCNADGMQVDHQGSIAANSDFPSPCCTCATFLSGIPFTQSASPNPYLIHSPLIEVGPVCTDPNQLWIGNTLVDIAGLQFRMNANSYSRVTYSFYQGYAPGPVVFGSPNPSFIAIFDNLNHAQAHDFALILHDTTTQAVSGGQKLQFQIRLEWTQVTGTGTISSLTAQQFELNWHYSHGIQPYDSQDWGCF